MEQKERLHHHIFQQTDRQKHESPNGSALREIENIIIMISIITHYLIKPWRGEAKQQRE